SGCGHRPAAGGPGPDPELDALRVALVRSTGAAAPAQLGLRGRRAAQGPAAVVGPDGCTSPGLSGPADPAIRQPRLRTGHLDAAGAAAEPHPAHDLGRGVAAALHSVAQALRRPRLAQGDVPPPPQLAALPPRPLL